MTTGDASDWPASDWPTGVGRRDHETLDSTNAEARRLAQAGERGPVWVVAKAQTAGRGRRGRAWLSGAGNLTATLLLRPADHRSQTTPGETATLSFAAALAVADMVAAVAPAARIAMKWPNDVLVNGRKLAGILLEGEGAGAGAWLAIGVGVNIAAAPESDAIGDAALPAIALGEIADPAPTAEQALTLLAVAMARRLADWSSQGFAGLRRDWLDKAARLGEPIVARLPDETVDGRFVDVDLSGALVLDTPQGPRRIVAADVFFSRPLAAAPCA